MVQVMPIHNPPFVQSLVPKVFAPFPDASSIHTYYGDEVAMYFAWMAFMCRWLAVPGGLGLATFVIHQLTGTHYRINTMYWAAAKIGPGPTTPINNPSDPTNMFKRPSIVCCYSYW